MRYRIELSSSAAKALAKIDTRHRLRIAGAIEFLAVEPRPPAARMLRGREHDRWRVRVGDYRVIYAIEDDRLLVYSVA